MQRAEGSDEPTRFDQETRNDLDRIPAGGHTRWRAPAQHGRLRTKLEANKFLNGTVQSIEGGKHGAKPDKMTLDNNLSAAVDAATSDVASAEHAEHVQGQLPRPRRTVARPGQDPAAATGITSTASPPRPIG